MSALKKYVVDVPDFPKKGILFKDITPLLANNFASVISSIKDLFPDEAWKNVDAIAGIEARGFTLAAGLAAKLNKNMIHIRKAGKLPGKVKSKSYGLEYGNDCLEMQYGNQNIIIIDDVLATGGTLNAACELSEQTGHNIIGIGVFMNLTHLNDFSYKNHQVHSVINYD